MKMGYGSREVIIRLSANQDELLAQLADVAEKADATSAAARKLIEGIKEAGAQKTAEE
ncbi:hypothetical protein [Vermiculatibacterium agrestimuris]|uniref:hypothetical protein n=1 Tax=Vermiculatibacterium agrestimuris TaxID=2941519 RepID=UPI00203B2D73|nr:hypothetical protein [Vermiculatibacterium agrestimuris]